MICLLQCMVQLSVSDSLIMSSWDMIILINLDLRYKIKFIYLLENP